MPKFAAHFVRGFNSLTAAVRARCPCTRAEAGPASGRDLGIDPNRTILAARLWDGDKIAIVGSPGSSTPLFAFNRDI